MATETIPTEPSDGSRLDRIGETLPADDRPTEPGTSSAGTLAHDGSDHRYDTTQAEEPTLGVPTEPGETVEGLHGQTAYRPPRPARPRYERLRLHARGGVGQVWVSLDGRFGREVALKELRPERQYNPQTAARFLAEARVTGKLVHPGIVAVHDLGEGPDGSPYYTMPFVAGKTLERAIADHHRAVGKGVAGSVERNALLLALVAVCNAVAYAHSRGIIHRDLKGQNVILGEFGESIVLDWGLAKSLDPADADWQPTDGPWLPAGATLDGQVMGTPAWMAPEQAEGRADLVGTRTDVYALGAILFQILTGRAPFDGDDSRVIIEKVRKEAPPTPRQVVPNTSKALDAICRKAMLRDPAARYASPLDLAADIQRWLADEPVSVLKETVTARIGRWGRRNRTAVKAGLILVGVGLIGLATSNVVFARLRQEALAAKARSDRNFDLAREAVEKMLVSVGDDRLAHVPQMEELRRTLTGEALDFYELFLRDGGDDPRVLQDAAQAYRRAGNVERYNGRYAAAMPLYRRSIGLLEGLVAQFPGNDKPQRRLVETLLDAGGAESLQDHPTVAVALFQRGIDIASALLASSTADRDLQILVGRGQIDLATAQNEIGLYEPGLTNAEAAIKRIGPFVGKPGVDPVMGTVLVIAEATRAWSLDHLGRVEEAETAYADLIRQARARAKALPEDHDRPYFLAVGLTNQGKRLGAVPAQGVEALGCLDEAVTILEKLAADFPTSPHYRQTLAECLGNRGRLRAPKGLPQAAEDLGRSRVLLEKLRAEESPPTSDTLGFLGRTFLGLGQLAEARGDKVGAAAHYRSAAEMLGKAVAAYPEKVEYKDDLARAKAAAAL